MTKVSAQGAVLLVDDNAALLENLTEILSEEGYETRTATSAAQAHAEAEAGFDVALVDLRLPDGNGIEVARELRLRRPDAEVVLLTGHASVESAAAAVRAGACAYLVKPCVTPELLLTVGQAMRQVRMHRQAREMARRAQVAEKLAAVGTLTAGLSHEIRNPLNAASLQLAVLDRRISRLDPSLQPALAEPLKLVRDEIRRLDHILEDFLQFARPRDFVAEPVDLRSLMRAVVDFLSEDAAQRRIELETDLDSEAVVAGENGRLRQVAVNLMLNAMDATGPDGRVRVSLVPQEEEVELLVEDSGPGIPEEMVPRILEPFFTTKSTGSGLGLSIVNAIIVQHGGAITIGRSELGGALFRVVLPRPTR